MTTYINRESGELYEVDESKGETPVKRNTSKIPGYKCKTQIVEIEELNKIVKKEIIFNEYLEDDIATSSEVAQFKAERVEEEIAIVQKQAIAKLKADMTEVYESADPFLQLQFKTIKDCASELIEAGDLQKVRNILQSPYIPANVQSIANEIQTILDEFIASM